MRHKPNYFNEKSDSKRGIEREDKACKQINSGRVWFSPRDLTVTGTDEEYLVDVKDVKKQKSYRLSLKDVERFFNQAIPKTPVYLIYMGDYIIKASIQRNPDGSNLKD